MAWRYTGKARVDPQHPQAFGVCDRCGFWHNLVDLAYQHEWRGRQLKNIRLRVCSRCLDVPFIFNRPIIYPPDPVPVADPRPQNFTIANNGSPYAPPLPWPVQTIQPPVVLIYLVDDAGDYIVDDDGAYILASDSPDPPPEPPVFETPPLPPLPPGILQSEP